MDVRPKIMRPALPPASPISNFITLSFFLFSRAKIEVCVMVLSDIHSESKKMLLFSAPLGRRVYHRCGSVPLLSLPFARQLFAICKQCSPSLFLCMMHSDWHSAFQEAFSDDNNFLDVFSGWLVSEIMFKGVTHISCFTVVLPTKQLETVQLPC
jgi:hypothetical protein